MKVVANISRGDLIRFNLYVAPRLRANWIFFGILVAGSFAYLTYESEPPVTSSILLTNLFTALLGGVVGMTFGLTVCLVFLFFSATHRSGQLGKHEYEIRSDGLFERTAANEAINKWPGILSISTSSDQIHVRVNSYMFHVIPRHSFRDDAEFNEYFEELRCQWRSAA
jgi:hypothetical protein